MVKKYKSSAILVLYINVDGVGSRLSFKPLTGGGSQFITNDEKLQKALDNHYDYGKKFVGAEVYEAPAPAIVKKVKQEGPKQVKAASLDDAKDYLADRYGYSRAKLRSKAAILAAAEENGIEFIGI